MGRAAPEFGQARRGCSLRRRPTVAGQSDAEDLPVFGLGTAPVLGRAYTQGLGDPIIKVANGKSGHKPYLHATLSVTAYRLQVRYGNRRYWRQRSLDTRGAPLHKRGLARNVAARPC